MDVHLLENVAAYHALDFACRNFLVPLGTLETWEILVTLEKFAMEKQLMDLHFQKQIEGAHNALWIQNHHYNPSHLFSGFPLFIHLIQISQLEITSSKSN